MSNPVAPRESRRAVCFRAVVASVLLASFAVTTPATAAEPPKPPSSPDPRLSPETVELRAAQAEARTTGVRQEIETARTEYATTYVNPSGTTTRAQSVTPVRVRDGAGWTDIDTTLVRRPDGSFGPRAALLDISFSGRDSQPLVRINRDAASVSLDAPWALREPTILDDTATYSDVLPGVDLVMKAEAEGFREVLVIEDREAAQQPELRELRFALQSAGVTMSETADGGLAATDAFGTELLTAARPTMWDSSSDTQDGEPHPETGADATSVTGPAEGDDVAPMDLAVDPSAVRVTPDADLLVSPTTTFPLYIDPAVNAGRTQWGMVNSSYPTTSYYKWGNGENTRGEGVGHISTALDGTHTKRLFYAFNTGSLNVSGRTIVSATFRAFQTWSHDCTAAGLEAWLTNPFTSSTTWAKQPTWVGPHTARTAPKYGRPDCTPGGNWLDFNVKNQVIGAQLKSWTTTTIGLKASSETANVGWRRFRNDATLEVEYNTFPNVPSAAQMLTPTTSCGGSVPGGDLPIMQVKVSDPDGTQNQVRARFQIFKSGESTPRHTYTTSPGASGATFRQQVPALANGTWAWRAQGLDAGNLQSGWTGLCNITVDGVAPKPPLIWYDGGNPTVGGDLNFHFTGGGSDVVSYRYAVNGDAPTSAAIGVFDGKAKIRATSFGPFTLRVWAYDAAGNRGGNASWPPKDPWLIGGTDALDWWRMNDGAGTTATNVKRANNGLFLQGPVAWGAESWDSTGSSLALNAAGATGAAIGGGGPADGGHFSVSAWLKVSASSGTGRRVVASQDAGSNAAFSLAVEKTAGPAVVGEAAQVANRVVATLYRSDGLVGLRVPSSYILEPGVWTHATMERINQPDGTAALELWVTDGADGETFENASTDTVKATTLAASSGYVRIGAESRSGAPIHNFIGGIDEVVTGKGPFDDQERIRWRKPRP
jgi:hypothetical protein